MRIINDWDIQTYRGFTELHYFSPESEMYETLGQDEFEEMLTIYDLVSEGNSIGFKEILKKLGYEDND